MSSSCYQLSIDFRCSIHIHVFNHANFLFKNFTPNNKMLETCHNFECNMFLKMLQYIHPRRERIQTMYKLSYVALHQSSKDTVNNILIYLSIYTHTSKFYLIEKTLVIRKTLFHKTFYNAYQHNVIVF